MTINNGTTILNGILNNNATMEIAQSNQELVLSKSKRKKRIWIIISIISAIIITLVIAAIILIKNGSSQEHKPIFAESSLNLEDFLNFKYNPKNFNGTWVNGNSLIYTNSNGDLILYNLATNTFKNLLYSNDSITLTAFDYKLSADQLYLLVAYDYQKLYRHSYRAKYMIINLTTNEKLILKSDDFGEDFFLVVWAPIGNALAYVYKNNIYYKVNAEASISITITNSNQTDHILNGIPDWVYEEEVFSSNKALWFSDDGTKIAFIRFDDSKVEIMVVPIYGEPGNLFFQYPRANFVKYPKAGTPNPSVNLFVYNIENGILNELLPTENLASKEPIITAVQWATNNSLIAVWMNRVQNNADLVVYQDISSTPTTIKSIKSAGWVEFFVPPKISADGSQLALILSKKNEPSTYAGDGSFKHLAIIRITESATEEFLTEGSYVVTEILGWNPHNNLIYYTANQANDSTVQHVYSVSPRSKEIKCISCSRKSKKNAHSSCLYNSAEMSTDSSYLVLTCNGPSIPSISIIDSEENEKITWTINEQLSEVLRKLTLPDKEKFEFPLSNGFTGKVVLKLPPNVDKSGTTKYPMLINVYGGPDTFQVTEKFSIDWGSYLATNKSIIYATIDGRGSGLRGDKLLYAGYRNLGTVEIQDQINMTKLIQENLPYVDAKRTAIWGWSYGGYAAAMVLANDTENIFKCGISVAPVTDWALYDSIYTERFMGLPTANDNLKGYEKAQLFKHYEGLRNKDYFLIHGTFDDNVHYQQSMMWAKVLERNDILFRQLSYTDEDHSLSSVRPHLYHSLEKFLSDCFHL